MEDEQSYVLSRYIVADPRICHGKLTFRGTRIFVADVLEQVARGMDWESIVEQWHGSISEEAITDAVRLAREALLTHVDDMRIRTKVAEPARG
jgi:uncharacterized protein (DUF433 family)